MLNKRELEFFSVDGVYYGGNQNWGRTWIMRAGGCSTITACEQVICLVQDYEGMRRMYPYNPYTVAKQEFLLLFEDMFKFVHPGIGGLTDIMKYVRGIESYSAAYGVQLSSRTLPGDASEQNAAQFIRTCVDDGRPVAYLMLRHVDRAFDDLEWHWFTVTGYSETDGIMTLSAGTYGQKFSFDLGAAWNTGHSQKGGLVSMLPWEHGRALPSERSGRTPITDVSRGI